jgi:hypothetical protein
MDLLIADIPGEIFPEAVAEEKVCRDLCALRRADHLVLFLDGGVLCNAANRHDHCGKVFDFVSRALQTEQIGQHTALHLVISKCDLLPKEATSEVLKFVKDIEEEFHAKFVSHFSGLRSCRIAARPVHPVDPTLEEISRLFAIWMSRSNHADPFVRPPHRSSTQRDFCRFGLLPEPT